MINEKYKQINTISSLKLRCFLPEIIKCNKDICDITIPCLVQTLSLGISDYYIPWSYDAGEANTSTCFGLTSKWRSLLLILMTMIEAFE